MSNLGCAAEERHRLNLNVGRDEHAQPLQEMLTLVTAVPGEVSRAIVGEIYVPRLPAAEVLKQRDHPGSARREGGGNKYFILACQTQIGDLSVAPAAVT